LSDGDTNKTHVHRIEILHKLNDKYCISPIFNNVYYTYILLPTCILPNFNYVYYTLLKLSKIQYLSLSLCNI